MRIPLDYYRILGLPIQATSEQLRQAHRDRTLQLPRREYSDAAISARKQLLDQAYEVLSAPTLRKSYDASFLAKTYEIASDEPLDGLDHAVSAPDDALLVDPHTPSVEIEEDQFIGALLVLQELGEYELVLKLGRPFLTGGSASLHDRRYGDPVIVFSDIVLTVALACLELGREQWQQGQYENAAEALETGQQLLLREGLFVNVRGEIQSDLYRLRPYRILELLAAPEEYAEARQTGLKLLQEMLRDRNGIDGTADDHSGLNIDDFLKFIQQLRGYLTAEEQRALFCQEANRPSAVATYLAVYALLAQGFAERYPELIQQASQYLAPLVNRQDVYLERAICALLLGQTEEASKALGLSQERDSIAFIQQHSYDSPDLLPGLCLYTEQWFHDEVFPHFRDLADCRLSLKDYFADRHVQHYLESLPEETPLPVEQPVYAAPQPERRSPLRTGGGATTAAPVATQTIETLEPSVVAARSTYDNPEKTPEHEALIATARARIASRTSTATLDAEEPFSASISTAERDIHPSTEADDMRRHTAPPQRGQSEPPTQTKRRPPRKDVDRPHGGRSAPPKWLIPLALLLSVILFGALGAWLFRAWLSNQPATTADEKPLVQLDQPLLELSAETTDATAAEYIDQDSAKRLIEQWLAAKSKAMGSTYDTADLNKILAEPKLAEWQAAAGTAKQEGWYRTYKHDVKVESVELMANGQVVTVPGGNGTTASPEGTANSAIAPAPTETLAPTAPSSASPSPEGAAATGDTPTAPVATAAPTPDQATVIANVKETTETYQDGNVAGASQTEDLRIQYNLVRKDGKWQIQGWQIL